MLTIICGEDIVSSRNYLVEIKSDFKKKGFNIQEIPASDTFELSVESSDNAGLFSDKIAFLTTNLDKYLKKFSRSEKGKKMLEKINILSKAKNLFLITWEESVSLYNLKLKNVGSVKEFKPTGNIFKLLNYCYPGNLTGFLTQLKMLAETADEQFIFIMLARHIRSLILARNNILSGVAPWQKYKLIGQAKKWSIEKLLGFYEGLHKIDISLKSGGSFRGVKESLDILSCFYL